MKFIYKKDFLKAFDFYPFFLQEAVLRNVQEIKEYSLKQTASYGLRVKKIGPHTFEARVTDKIRIVWIKKDDLISFVLLGSHDDVKKFIKHL